MASIFCKSDQRADDKDEREQRFAVEHPYSAEAIVDPAVERGHIGDGNVADRLAKRVFRRSDAAADRVHD